MTQESHKLPVPRKLRNTAKQSLLIVGQPDFLYKYKEIKETFIEFNGVRRSLGNISDDIHLKLIDVTQNTDTKITRVSKTVKCPLSSLEGFPSISIQKHKKDTMIVIPSHDEESLIKKISKFKELIESKDIVTQERCNWICLGDKAKTPISNNDIREMSEKTKSLHKMAVEAVNKKK